MPDRPAKFPSHPAGMRSTASFASQPENREAVERVPTGFDALTGTEREPRIEKPTPVAFPLDCFYAFAGRPLPVIGQVNPCEIPEPYRSLLVHQDDMTPTLEAHYRNKLRLRPLNRQQRDDFYFREVVLIADGLERPVEFGAIRINLALFPREVRREILQERLPLGHLLETYAVPHASQPKAFLRLETDAFIGGALQLSEPRVLYGRRNRLLDSVQRSLAEVVEILSVD